MAACVGRWVNEPDSRDSPVNNNLFLLKFPALRGLLSDSKDLTSHLIMALHIYLTFVLDTTVWYALGC